MASSAAVSRSRRSENAHRAVEEPATGPILFAALAVPVGYRVLLLVAGVTSLGIVGLSLIAGVLGR